MRTPDVSEHGEPIFWLHLTAFMRIIKGVTNPSATLHKKKKKHSMRTLVPTKYNKRALAITRKVLLFYLCLARPF